MLIPGLALLLLASPSLALGNYSDDALLGVSYAEPHRMSCSASIRQAVQDALAACEGKDHESCLHDLLSHRLCGVNPLHQCPATLNHPLPEELPRELTNIPLRVLVMILVLLAGGGLWYCSQEMDKMPGFAKKTLLKFVGAKHHHLQGVHFNKLISYHLDRWLSTDPHSKVLVLTLTTIMLIFVGWLALFAAGEVSLYSSFWSAVAGAGLNWQLGDADTFAVRVVSLLLSIGGMLITALLLSLVSESIQGQVDELKRGKSEVVESNHIVIIGWSIKIFTLISELCMGSECNGGLTIVVFSTLEKEEMEEQLTDRDINLRNSTVVCRTGDPLVMGDLSKVSVKYASSIVILACRPTPEESDAHTLRVVINLFTMFKCMEADGKEMKAHILAEVCKLDQASLTALVAKFYPGAEEKLHILVTSEVLSRMMAQNARCPFLGQIMSDLVGFEGCEFYTMSGDDLKPLLGRPFSEMQLVLPDAIPFGVKNKEDGVVIGPPRDYIIKEGDSLYVLAEDFGGTVPKMEFLEQNLKDISDSGKVPKLAEGKPQSKLKTKGLSAFRAATNAVVAAKRIDKMKFGGKFLILGWRKDIVRFILVLDSFMTSESELWLYSDVPLKKRRTLLEEEGLVLDKEGRSEKLLMTRVHFDEPHLHGSLLSSFSLERLDPISYRGIMLLSPEPTSASTVDVTEQASCQDSNTLNTVFLLRAIQLRQYQKMQEEGKILDLPSPACTKTSIIQPALSSEVQVSGGSHMTNGEQDGREGWQNRCLLGSEAVHEAVHEAEYETGAAAAPSSHPLGSEAGAAAAPFTHPHFMDMFSPSTYTSPHYAPRANLTRSSSLTKIMPAVSRVGGRGHALNRTSSVAVSRDERDLGSRRSKPLAVDRVEVLKQVHNPFNVDFQMDHKEMLQRVGAFSTLVSQLLDPKTLEIMSGVAGKVNRYLMSTDSMSQMLALVATSPDRLPLFRELFGPTGRDVHTLLVDGLIMSDKEEGLSFVQMAERLAEMDQIPVGYIEEASGKLYLNPPNKFEKILKAPKPVVGVPCELKPGEIRVLAFVVVS